MDLKQIRERIQALEEEINSAERRKGFPWRVGNFYAHLAALKAERDHLRLNELPKHLKQIERVPIGFAPDFDPALEADFNRRMEVEHQLRLKAEYERRLRSRKMLEIEFEEYKVGPVFGDVQQGQFFLNEANDLCLAHYAGGYVTIAYFDGSPAGYLDTDTDEDMKINKIFPMFRKFKINV